MNMHLMERRLAVVEARLAEAEGGHGEVLYKLNRRTVELRLNVAQLLAERGLTPVTQEAVEEALDAE